MEHPYFVAVSVALGVLLAGCIAVLGLLGAWAWTGWRTAIEDRRRKQHNDRLDIAYRELCKNDQP